MNDTIQINIQNTQQPNLSPCVPGQHQTPDCFDHTNFHTHGLHISPKLRSDNVLISIAPAGESSARCEEKPECTAAPHQGCCYKGEFEHRYELGKGVEGGRHYPGTFWYHAHKHGSTAVQLASGMAGALIIEDPVGSPIQGFQERVLLLQQLAFDDRGTVLPQGGPLRQLRRNWSRDGEAQRYTTINGVAKPGIPMCSGEVQRWRVIDGGVFEMVPIELAWVRGSTSRVATRTAQLIAIDGITLKQARDVFGRQGGGPLDMGPGYRLDLLVKDWPELRRLGFKLVLRKKAPTDQSMVFSGMDDAGPNQVLAEVIPDTSARCQQPYRTELLRQDMPLPAPLPDLDEVQGRRVVEFSVRREEPRFLINGRTFHHEVDREFCLPMGRKEEWTLSTARGSGVHPFHIHVNAFQMIRDGKPAEWRDTILIREGEDLTMRTFYENFDGRFVLHCHILNHEDEGMMQLVEISKSNPPRCIGPASVHQENTHGNEQKDEQGDKHKN
jgi:FtsP/CotA-like multicopper oxidase with cupredoxin domain